MTDEHVPLTQKDIREFVRILRDFDRDIQNMKEKRQSEGTPRLIRTANENAVASDTVVSVTSVADPAMVWDDPNRGWEYSEWGV